MPSYNYVDYLSMALQSCLCQTMDDFEIIVVEGSTDGSYEVVKNFAKKDKRIRVFRQKPGGYALAVNLGLNKAKGKYIALHDADDLAMPTKMQLLSDYLDKHDDTDLVYGSYYTLANGKLRKIGAKGFNLAKFYLRNTFMASAAMFRRKVFEDVGDFDESLPTGWEWDFFLRAGLAGKKFATIDCPLYVRICHNKNISYWYKGYGKVRKQIRAKYKTSVFFKLLAYLSDVPWQIRRVLSIK